MKRKVTTDSEKKVSISVSEYQALFSFLLDTLNPSSIVSQFKSFHFFEEGILSSDGRKESLVLLPHNLGNFSIDGVLLNSLFKTFSSDEEIDLILDEKEGLVVNKKGKKTGNIMIITDEKERLDIEDSICFPYIDTKKKGLIKCLDGKEFFDKLNRLSIFGAESEWGISFDYVFINLEEEYAICSDGYRALLVSMEGVLEKETKKGVYIAKTLVDSFKSLGEVDLYLFSEVTLFSSEIAGKRVFRGAMEKEIREEEVDEIINSFSEPQNILMELDSNALSILEQELTRLSLFMLDVDGGISCTFDRKGMFLGLLGSPMKGKWEGRIEGKTEKECKFVIKLSYLKDLIRILDKDKPVKLYDSERLIAFEQGDMEGIITKKGD